MKELSESVLNQKLVKILSNASEGKDIVFFCIGNYKICFDAFGIDVFISFYLHTLKLKNDDLLFGGDIDNINFGDVINRVKFGDVIEFQFKNRKIMFVCANEVNSAGKIYWLYDEVKRKFNNPYVIAVDACLSKRKVRLGTLIVKNRGLIPKSGIINLKGKSEKEVNNLIIGDASISCVLGNIQENDVLENQFNGINQMQASASFESNLQENQMQVFANFESNLQKNTKICGNNTNCSFKPANAWVEKESVKRTLKIINFLINCSLSDNKNGF